MSGFKRRGREGIDPKLQPVGHGWIRAALFDLGIYPAAIPASDSKVRGEVHRMIDGDAVLGELDQIEGYRASEPDVSLYTRVRSGGDLRRWPRRQRVGVLLQCSARPSAADRVGGLSEPSQDRMIHSARLPLLIASMKSEMTENTRFVGSMNSIPER